MYPSGTGDRETTTVRIAACGAGRSTTTTTTCTRRIATTTTRRTRTTTSGFVSPKPLNPCLAAWRIQGSAGGASLRPDPRGSYKLTRPCRAQGPPGCPACPSEAPRSLDGAGASRAGEEEGPAVVSSRKAKGAAGPLVLENNTLPSVAPPPISHNRETLAISEPTSCGTPTTTPAG